MHADLLWAILQAYFTVAEYAAAGLEPSRRPVGKGFFPVSTGTWDLPKNAAHRPLLFLGQDFGVMLGHSDEGETTAVPTWRHLEPLMSEAGIDARSCFFTNALMGVRPKGVGSVGRSSAFGYPQFVEKCASFVVAQLEVVKPCGVVVLGLPALEVLTKVGWSNIPETPTFEAWDNGNEPSLITAQLGPWNGPLALIVHPSFRPLNVKRRSKSGDHAEGNAHEVRLLKSLVSRPATHASKG